MLYPADNYPRLSKNIHSLGVDQRVTTAPTFGNKALVANAKYFASRGLQGLGGYNDLVQSQTLSWFAQPINKYILLGGAALLAFWYTMGKSKGHRYA
jgi:hypothetical protein